MKVNWINDLPSISGWYWVCYKDYIFVAEFIVEDEECLHVCDDDDTRIRPHAEWVYGPRLKQPTNLPANT